MVTSTTDEADAMVTSTADSHGRVHGGRGRGQNCVAKATSMAGQVMAKVAVDAVAEVPYLPSILYFPPYTKDQPPG